MIKSKLLEKHVLRNARARYDKSLAENGTHHKDTLLAQAAFFEVAIKRLERKKEKIINLRKRLLEKGHTIQETSQLRMESRAVGEQITKARATLKDLAKQLQI
jgi:hypothetical protein